MNTIKTALFLGLLTAVLVLMGSAVGGMNGALVFFLIAIAINFSSYWWSDKIVLSIYRAQPVTEQQEPKLYSIIRELTTKAGLPMPKVYVLPQETPNAFATGRNPKHAVVAVTQGILRLLNADELKGVIAHELSHIQNRDILISTIAATIAGAVTLIAQILRFSLLFASGRRRDENILGILILSILAPIAAVIIQLAVSRSREYQADASAAKLLGNGHSLASALQKLDMYVHQRPMTQGSHSTAHLFIVNPFKRGFLTSLFSTHPPIEERIKRLEQ